MKLNPSTLGIILVIAFHIVGLLLFCKGYLLTRIVVPAHATCPVQQNPSSQTCTGYPKQFKRILWVIIDALRYDFTVYDDTLDPVPYYRNKLPYIRDLLRDEPNNARLYRFYADAPTTTLQRLKALSTGSLPTFIDFSLNFKGHEVTEDSLPHQMAANDKTVTFLGDDTWIGLYPNYFNTVMALPSFNVKDLHTVDNGVMKYLIPELKYSDADWIIGHFLGVDHCGHTYGPSHPAMAEKLEQMNGNLKLIFEQLDNDTIVFVFGDHGMTKGGDHGGESYLETGSALFVYSHQHLFCNKQEKDTISQIDLVPTMALLMGIPIPYSSLGAAIADILQPCNNGDEATMEYLTALASNGHQIHDYLQAYSRISGEFPVEEYRNLQQLFNRTVMQHRALSHTFMLNGFINASAVKSTIKDYYQFMYSVKSMCISVWAKFDDFFINQGILVLLLGCIVNVCMLWHARHPHVVIVTGSLCSGLCLIVGLTMVFTLATVLYLEWDLLGVIGSALFMIFTFISLLTIYSVKSQIIFVIKQFAVVSVGLLFEPVTTLSNVALSVEEYIDTVISCAILLCSSATILSNSFIIYEGWVLTFFIQTLIVCKVVRDCVYNKTDGIGRHILIHVILMMCIRCSELFWTCREEVIECKPTHFTFPFGIIREDLGPLWSLLRFTCYIILVAAIPIWLLWWLRSNQMWNHLSYQLRCLLVMMVPASLCVCGFWIVQGFVSIKQLDQMPHWQHVILPRIVYVLCNLTMIKCIHESCWVKPVDQKMNMAFIAKAYHVVMTTVAWIILVMLFHDGSALAVAILLIQSFLLIHLHHNNTSYSAGSWSLAVLWHLTMVQLYYATGHQPTITGMKLDAGFVGQRGEMVGYKLVLGGLLVGLNSFVAQVLLPWMVPLFILWPHSKTTDQTSFSTTTSTIRVAILKLLFCQTVKLFFAVLAASMHRRHLMVWGIFAPRFIYESSFALIIDLVLVLSYLYVTLTLRRCQSTKQL